MGKIWLDSLLNKPILAREQAARDERITILWNIMMNIMRKRRSLHHLINTTGGVLGTNERKSPILSLYSKGERILHNNNSQPENYSKYTKSENIHINVCFPDFSQILFLHCGYGVWGQMIHPPNCSVRVRARGEIWVMALTLAFGWHIDKLLIIFTQFSSWVH